MVVKSVRYVALDSGAEKNAVASIAWGGYAL